MGFQTGLSGLNTSSKTLDVIGNNIANANTVGFKSSRNEFAELVSASLGSVSAGRGLGIGAAVSNVAQQFTQGNVNITGNSLDVAINGSGFFQVSKQEGTTAFTRDGQFKIDTEGNIRTNTGASVMGFPTDKNGLPTSITLQKLTIPSGAPLPAQQTTEVNAELNLDARVKFASTAPVTPVGTYGTSLTAFDAQGVPLPVNLYFSRIDPAVSGLPVPASLATAANQATDQWAIYDKVNDGAVPPGPPIAIGYMSFDSTGKLAGVFDATLVEQYATDPNLTFGQVGLTLTPTPRVPAVLDTAGNVITPAVPSIVPPFLTTLDLSKVTQFGIPFAVSDLSQDGYTAGDLTGVTIEATGIITTRYSNGQTQSTGKIALADFRNLQGLAPIGGGEFLETFTSGQPVLGSPGIGKFGELRSGAIEESNVDLTAELVNLLTAQRNYQANAQTIKAQDSVQQTLVNLR